MRRPGHGRAALLGGGLTLGVTTGVLVLARETGRVWPGTGVVDTDAALLTVTLAGATMAAAWVGVVLALATVEMLRSLGDEESGPEGAARARTVPRPVRLTCAVLMAVSGSTAWPALAAPPALMSTQAQPGVVSTQPEPVAVSTQAQPVTVSTQAEPGVAPTQAQPSTLSTQAQPGGRAVVQPRASLGSPPSRPDDAGRAVPQPGWTPTLQAATPVAPDGVGLVSAQPHESLPEEVVVRRGDTLWDIAARHLGPGASTAEVAEEWPRWYAANVDVVGSDPDLIVPGTQLVAPGRGHAEGLDGARSAQETGR